MIRIKRINKEDVAPVKYVENVEDPRPVRGKDVFPEVYANVFFCARKKSGKSCAIYHTIKSCATRESKVIAFCATLNRDPTWKAIQKLCEDMNVDFTGYTSIKDPETKEDILGTILEHLEKEKIQENEGERIKKKSQILTNSTMLDKEKKPKKPKEKAPEIFFIFDDLSGELNTPSVIELLKMNRHFKSKTLIASQYWNDIPLQARKQIDYVLLYKGLAQSMEKLMDIYKNCDLSVPFDVFTAMYRMCTHEKYHFLYIDVVNSEFRKDFSHKIELPKEEEDEDVTDI